MCSYKNLQNVEVMDDTVENQANLRAQCDQEPLAFYGVFGTIDLHESSYLILIKRAEVVGEIMNC